MQANWLPFCSWLRPLFWRLTARKTVIFGALCRITSGFNRSWVCWTMSRRIWTVVDASPLGWTVVLWWKVQMNLWEWWGLFQTHSHVFLWTVKDLIDRLDLKCIMLINLHGFWSHYLKLIQDPLPRIPYSKRNDQYSRHSGSYKCETWIFIIELF